MRNFNSELCTKSLNSIRYFFEPYTMKIQQTEKINFNQNKIISTESSMDSNYSINKMIDKNITSFTPCENIDNINSNNFPVPLVMNKSHTNIPPPPNKNSNNIPVPPVPNKSLTSIPPPPIKNSNTIPIPPVQNKTPSTIPPPPIKNSNTNTILPVPNKFPCSLPGLPCVQNMSTPGVPKQSNIPFPNKSTEGKNLFKSKKYIYFFLISIIILKQMLSQI